ncbi:hypothetical protein K1T71_008127 [Dendrolimus kikuchii]|uniref:Uncharacterized protein n=1 Tax=Dendrolimus kikuchii TaxID=765133 RepID=A0ACC1CWC6_9NEOP|nr:hypothetical protein K1T71_008127 [Dendrolimus kikuchii]
MQTSNSKKNKAGIKWTNKWIPFIDSLIQFNAFARDHDGVSTPKLIRKLLIDTERHRKEVAVSGDSLEACLYKIYDHSRCGGVEIDGLVFIDKPTTQQEPDVLQTRTFVPHFMTGQWGGYYFLSNNKFTKSNNVELVSGTPGDLDSLSWIESAPNSLSNNLIEVHYSGISIEDVQYAAGKFIKNNNAFGIDFSGLDKTGKRVMGLVSGGSLANTVLADPDLLWPVPEYWTLEEAATVPLPYIYAYYCLTMKTIGRKIKSILVNGADGALGQAIIAITLEIDCDVYATVSDLKKKEFLLKIFPELHDLCEYDTTVTDTFDMNFLTGSTHYVITNLSAIFKPEYAEEKKLLRQKVADGIAKGVVRPLSRVVYSPTEVTRAFRLVSTNRQVGKVMIKMKDPEDLKTYIKVIPRTTYSAYGTYIVVCNESLLGVELIDRLVKKGAKKLVVHIKPNTISGYCYSKLMSWRKHNVTIKIVTQDLHTQESCKSLLNAGKNNSTDDRLEPEYLAAKFNKAIGVVANLDIVSRNLCNELIHFVVLNYCSSESLIDEYVSSVTDKICQARSDVTLPALVLRVRLLNKLNQINNDLPTKIRPQILPSVFNSLECCLKLKYNNAIAFSLHKHDSLVSKILSMTYYKT